MTTTHSDPLRPPVSALERGLDELAELVRADVEPPQFFRELLRLLVHTARADEAVTWLRTSEDAWTRLTPSTFETASCTVATQWPQEIAGVSRVTCSVVAVLM